MEPKTIRIGFGIVRGAISIFAGKVIEEMKYSESYFNKKVKGGKK